jgi:hypothetical protein
LTLVPCSQHLRSQVPAELRYALTSTGAEPFPSLRERALEARSCPLPEWVAAPTTCGLRPRGPTLHVLGTRHRREAAAAVVAPGAPADAPGCAGTSALTALRIPPTRQRRRFLTGAGEVTRAGSALAPTRTGPAALAVLGETALWRRGAGALAVEDGADLRRERAVPPALPHCRVAAARTRRGWLARAGVAAFDRAAFEVAATAPAALVAAAAASLRLRLQADAGADGRAGAALASGRA